MGTALVTPAYSSARTLLYLGGPTSPPDYVLQGRLGDIKFGGVSIDIVDVSNQESAAHRTLATLLKSGDMTANIFWEPDQEQDQELFGLIIAEPPALQQWMVKWPVPLPSTYSWIFNGWLSKFAPDASIGKSLMAPITVSIDDSITPVFTA
jgi:Lambda phage tail tube protein, TTP